MRSAESHNLYAYCAFMTFIFAKLWKEIGRECIVDVCSTLSFLFHSVVANELGRAERAVRLVFPFYTTTPIRIIARTG